MTNSDLPQTAPRSFLDSFLLTPSFSRMTVRLKRGEKAGYHKWNGDLMAPRGQRWETDDELKQRRRVAIAAKE